MLSNKLIKRTIALKANVKLHVSSLVHLVSCRCTAPDRQREGDRVGDRERHLILKLRIDAMLIIYATFE